MLLLLAAAQFVGLSPEITGVTFRHQSSRTAMKYLPEAMGGGVAIFDYDGDGLPDLFFTNGAELKVPQKDRPLPAKAGPAYWNRIYRNLGGFRFEDVTERLGLAGEGYSMGVAVGDIDNDGYADLLVTNYGSVNLYHNERGKSFKDITREVGLDSASGWMSSAGFFDADNDGYLDIFIARYLDYSFEAGRDCGLRTRQGRSYCHPDEYPPIASLFYRNEGGGQRFSDVSRAAGIAAHKGKSLGVAFADFDADGLTDIAVANDSEPQFLFRNKGGMRFEEIALAAGVALDADGEDFAGMGIEAADLDQNGLADLLITTLSLQRYAFFRAVGKAVFTYATPETKLGAITHKSAGWGLKVFDADNDTAPDVFFANSHVMDNIAQSQPGILYEQPPLLLRYAKGVFEKTGSGTGPVFETPLAARGLAAGDLDNDGCVDLVVGINNGGPVVLQNRCAGAGHHWLAVQLEGVQSNRAGYGAQVVLTLPDGRAMRAACQSTGSYLSAHDARVHFGLGAARKARLTVRWPSGRVQGVEVAEVDRLITVRERD